MIKSFWIISLCVTSLLAFTPTPLTNRNVVRPSNVKFVVSPCLHRDRDGPLYMSNSETQQDALSPPVDPLVRETSKLLQRASWFSWWSQVILTTISSVILIFAKTTITNGVYAAGTPSLLLSGVGIFISAASIIWTWGNGARLSRRLVVKPTTRFTAAKMLRRAIDVGATLNLLGLLSGLLAAQQIIGGLAIKVLTTTGRTVLMDAGSALQPLDVLIVQANTNSLLSQFCSLASLLYMAQKQLPKLDPPSTDDAPRK